MVDLVNCNGRKISVYQLMAEVRLARNEYNRAKDRGTEQELNVAYGKLYELEHLCESYGLNMG